jgi:signal transduction histidine kinase
LVEDRPQEARLVYESLVSEATDSVQLRHAQSLAQAVDLLDSAVFDAALTDLDLPDSHGIATYRALHLAHPDLPIVVLSGTRDRDRTVRAIHEGAQDFLLKGRADGELLIRAIRHAIERQELERQRGEFLALLSHELRTPLTSILGWAQMSQRSQATPAIATVIDQARYMERLLQDLLDAARADLSEVELHRRDLDLISVARECVEAAQGTTDQHEIILNCMVPELIGHWDSDRLKQVFQNLLSNAIKYSPRRGLIMVTVSAGDGVARVSVSDNGDGLVPEALNQVFSRSYRSDAARQGSTSGLGIGLHIARVLVEAHGGTIRASSPGPHLGSTFSFILPCPAPPN